MKSKGIIIITGSSRGIGAATALLASAAGYTVCVNYHTNHEAAHAVVNKIISSGGKAFAIQANVGVQEDIIKLFNEVDKQSEPLTALVNNAGILLHQSLVSSMDAERLHHIFSVNAIGPFLCSREAVKRMSTKNGGKGGAIVNVSSTAIKQGGASAYVDYAASKGALEILTIGLAKEVAAEGIRVNAVRPGIVYTDIHASGGEPDRVNQVSHTIPMGRVGNPEEIGKAIMWLLSNEASYSTGAILDVSGGR